MIGSKRTKRAIGSLVRPKRPSSDESGSYTTYTSNLKPTVYHALVVIFLEFFAWGLLTTPTIKITQQTFPQHTFLINGLIQGVKGILSFLCAPLIGALSDILGRKPFLILTVTCTCAPIPFLMLSPWWYFALITLSGAFSVTFSVVFAYVADITSEEERSSAYGLVSATFAASLITSPAIGAFIDTSYSHNSVVLIATAVATLDVLFIILFMPESLPENMRPASSWGAHFTWDKADPFGALKKLGHDKLILLLCFTVLLSYLPEAGEYSCFFVYLKLKRNFSEQQVASFIAFVGILSVLAQTVVLAVIMSAVGAKKAIIIGLTAEMIQLAIYGFGSAHWLMWLGGLVAAISSIAYPAISAFVSSHAHADQQGVAQGVVTGIRGLCNGLGPALFGFVFYLFHVDLKLEDDLNTNIHKLHQNSNTVEMADEESEPFIPGPPFAAGAVLVMLAIIVATYIPTLPRPQKNTDSSKVTRQNSRESPTSSEKAGLSYEKEKLLKSTEEII